MYYTTIFLLIIASSTLAEETHKKHACEHLSLELSCPSGELIEINYANYGRTAPGKAICPGARDRNVNCRLANTINIVKKSCEKQKKCTLSASASVFGDPCVETHKYLEIAYTCRKANIVCEDAILKLTCGANEVINIKSANYGRTVTGDVLCQLKGHDSMTTCFAPNSYEVVKSICNNRRYCSVHAHNYVFGDPCVGTRKYLEVNYECENLSGSVPTTVTPNENGEGPITQIGKNTLPAAIWSEIKKAYGNDLSPLNTLIYINNFNVFHNVCDVHLDYHSHDLVPAN